MLLHEIISLSEQSETGILIEEIAKYKRSLVTYYKEYYCCEPVLIVTAVFNAAQYGFIAPCDQFSWAIDTYLNSDDSLNEEGKETERELINFQSIMLSNL